MGNHRTTNQHYSALRAALDDASLTSVEHQLNLAARISKKPQWRLNTREATAEFITHSGLVITGTVHPIGVHHQNKWLWSWADTRISETRRGAAQQVRAFGHEHELSVFTRPLSDISPRRTRVTPGELITASKIIHRVWNHFVFPMPDGSRLYAAVELPDLELPSPTPQSISQTLRTTHPIHPATRPLRAALSYAGIRGITHQVHRSKTSLRFHTNTGSLNVWWDAGGFQTETLRRATTHTTVTH